MNIYFAAAVITLMISSCNSGEHDAKPTLQPIDIAAIKARTYERLYSDIAGPSGFFIEDDCDSLLFNGLYCASGQYRDITVYRDDATGKWIKGFRTPSKTCYEQGRSASEISREMILGAMWCMWAHDKKDDLEKLRQYGKSVNWLMGEGPIDRTFFTTNLQKTLYLILGRSYKGLEDIWIDPIKDHQRHSVALNIILRGEHEGHVSDQMLALLEEFAAKEPHNALFQYGVARFTDGNQAETINILVNDRWFPRDRLPHSEDRCGRWLWERSNSNKAWKPCDDPATHSGGDLRFIVWLLERSKDVVD